MSSVTGEEHDGGLIVSDSLKRMLAGLLLETAPRSFLDDPVELTIAIPAGFALDTCDLRDLAFAVARVDASGNHDLAIQGEIT